jgi:hypothetical protein
MNMKLDTLARWLAAAVLLAPLCTVRADEAQLDPETKARIERFEKGPATIDVSGYPKGIQENYKVFREKCTLCHALSRPINSDYVLPDEWSRYVKRMMFKPGSNITANSAKNIYSFLAYDSSVRKRTQLEEALAKLNAEEKAAAEAKIKEVHAEYDGK